MPSARDRHRVGEPAERAATDADLGSGQGTLPPASADHGLHRRPGVLLRRSCSLARGSNENINGLVRDYFAKGTDLSVAEIQRVALEINHRPRKTLGWSRPAVLFENALTTA